MESFNQIKSFANMLSKTLGLMFQITVSDTEQYLFVDNPIDPSLKAGDPISGNERFFIQSQEITELPFVVNYKSLSTNMHKLRSSTYFYKDGDNQIVYMLSLSIKVDEFFNLRTMLDGFVNGARDITNIDTDRIDQLPKLELAVGDLVDAVILEGQNRYNTKVERMKKTEKHSLLNEMASRGVFLIKGAVSEVARKLNYSEATVYKYLQKLEKSEKEADH